MPYALVTGATSGIGAAFAEQLAAAGYDLTLVARDPDRLARTADALHRKHGVLVTVLAADLASDDGLARVAERAAAEPLDLLVNNAGFAHPAGFLRVPAADEVRMMRVHCEAVLRLTHAALPGMNARGRGGIVNVSSLWAFFPRSTYGASKAWINAFSRSLTDARTARSGVRVMALCPGYVRTALHERSGRDTSSIPRAMWTGADDVVRTALRDLERGRTVCVPGAADKALVLLGRLAGRRFAGRVLQRLGSRPRRPAP
ncbi:SDR family NAD(P)-dependent oxidoreductase [Streptomyces globosus]|uniref:SDR family NAD(P)-dependent oxidoreductase n=1 Tax=Streptomyces globosus TaxID=68209 RepID=UPI003809637D